MAILEELRPGIHLKGLLPGKLVNPFEVKPYGASVVEVIYKYASGLLGTIMLHRQDAAHLDIASKELLWNYENDGIFLSLVPEAYRIILEYLFDLMITSNREQ